MLLLHTNRKLYIWNDTMFGDHECPLNASLGLSASAELLVLTLSRSESGVLFIRGGYINQSINQSINGGDRRRHQSASMSVSYFLYSAHIQINLITTYILRSVSSSGKISCVIKNNILVNPYSLNK